MKLSGPVLAATAIDPAGQEAIRQAAEHARAASVPLVVCHVMPDMYGIRPLFPQLRESDRAIADSARDAAGSALEAQVERALGDASGHASLRIDAGSPHTAVLEVAESIGAGLVVVGAGSQGAGASLGGVAERIVRHAACPVLVARARSGGAVLAATDFSDPSLPAILEGRAEATRVGARFAVVHAVELRMLPMESPESAPSIMMADLIQMESEEAIRVLEELRVQYGAEEAIVRFGAPADVIIEEAARIKADLVVVGTHGRSGFRRLTLGSVAESVVRRADCSILVVRLSH